MAQVKANPLPPGWYQADVPQDRLEAFNGWLERNRGAVVVRATDEIRDEGTTIFDFDDFVVHWFLFQVTAPVEWEGPGYPDTAGEETTSEDSVKRPPPEPGWTPEAIGTGLKGFAAGALVVGIVGIGAIAALHLKGDD